MCTKLKNFKLYTGIDCLYSCLVSITNYYQMNYRETHLYYMTEAFKYRYWDTEDAPYFYFGRSFENCFQKLNDNILYNVGEDAFDLDKITYFLEQGHPVMLTVNTMGLQYSEYYKNNNRKHCVILTGVDLGQNMLLIGDPHIRDYSGNFHTFLDFVPLSDIESCTVHVRFFDSEKKLVKLDEKSFIKSFPEQIDDYLHNPSLGAAAFERFRYTLSALENVSDTILIKVCMDMTYCLKIESAIRNLEFLSVLLKELFIDRYEIICRKLIAGWNILSNTIIKYGYSRQSHLLESVTGDYNSLVCNQNELYKNIADYFSKNTWGGC